MSIQLAFPNAPVPPLPAPNGLLQNLAALRQEWEVAADGDNLLDVSASVGLMLVDIATSLGFTAEERALFLGASLDREVSALLEDSQA